MLDEDDRRAGKISKEARLAETADEGEPQETTILQKIPVGGKGMSNTFPVRIRLMGFRQEENDDGKARKADYGNGPEDGAPIEECRQGAAGQRRQDGRNAE